MKVLLDEMLPIGVSAPLPEHDVATAGYVGLAGLPNEEVIRRAIAAGFDVILTLDRGIPHQQNLAREAIGFVLLADNDVDLIHQYAERLRDGIEAASPGTVIRIAPLR